MLKTFLAPAEAVRLAVTSSVLFRTSLMVSRNTLGADGTLTVVDNGNHRVQRFARGAVAGVCLARLLPLAAVSLRIGYNFSKFVVSFFKNITRSDF